MKRFDKEEIKAKIKNHHLYKRALESKRFLLFLLVLMILISYNYFSHGFIFDLANNDLQDTLKLINESGNPAWLIYIILVISETILVPISGILINSAAAVIFNPLITIALTLIGNIIGASLAYFIARRYGGFYFEKLISEKKLKSFNKYNNKYGALVLFILRLNPITSSDIFNYIAGIIEMPYKKFIISTILGIIPTIVIISYFGGLFIQENPLLKLFFFIIAFIYIIIFLYGYYKIGKEKFKGKISNFRK
ncbi:MAG: TVP38/TMEM64 family protein [Nanoarchaeota archaeon]